MGYTIYKTIALKNMPVMLYNKTVFLRKVGVCMKKIFVISILFVLSCFCPAFADFDYTNINNLGKNFKNCTPYKSPEFPNGKNGIALQQILGMAGDKCHYQEYGFYGPERKKITSDCFFSKDDLKILSTLNSKNHVTILIQYLNDPYSCTRKEN